VADEVKKSELVILGSSIDWDPISADDTEDPPASSSSSDKWREASKTISLAAYTDNEIISKSINTFDSMISMCESIIAILKTLGKLINAFQTDYNNLLKVINAVISSIIESIEELMVSLSSTGLYVLPVVPNASPFEPDEEAGGGFDAFMSKVKKAMTNKLDPNRPIFYEGDYVGGLVVVLTAGTNLGDLVKDFEILLRFLQDEPNRNILSPVLGLSATPGLYYKNANAWNSSSFKAAWEYISTDTIIGSKYPGIKLTWSPPAGVPVDGYKIDRSKTAEGSPRSNKELANATANENETTKEYIDYSFNKGVSVNISGSDDNMEFTDFEVEDGITYYYKVTPYLLSKTNDIVDCKTISSYTSATARTCVPQSAIESNYETPDGLLKGVATGDPPYWSNTNLRGLFGPELDSLLDSMHGLAKRFGAVSTTSSSHFDRFILLLEKWIDFLADLIAKIKAVIEALSAFKLSGSASLLVIPAEYGGITGFRDRVSAATIPSAMAEAIKQDGACSVYAGMVILAGAPTNKSLDRVGEETSIGVAKIRSEGNFEKAKAAYEETKSATNDLASHEYVQKTIEFITRLF